MYGRDAIWVGCGTDWCAALTGETRYVVMLIVTAVSTFGAGSTVSSGGETYFGVLACARLEAVGRVGRRHFSFYLIEIQFGSPIGNFISHPRWFKT